MSARPPATPGVLEPRMPQALIVDDDTAQRESLAALVAQAGFSIETAGDIQQARRRLHRCAPAVALIDLHLPDGHGMSLIAELSKATSEIILVTGHASLDSVIEALRLGATDYLTKPIDVMRLHQLLARVPKPPQREAQLALLRRELMRHGRFGQLLGQSDAMLAVYRQMQRVASTTAPVLIHGESGTGKETAARSLHDFSPRAAQPFIAVDCATLSTSQVDAEFFGQADEPGCLEQASGGTLFLANPDRLPDSVQAALLRLLETGSFRRANGRQAQADLRLIASLQGWPTDAVMQKRLRADFYHHLVSFPIEMPALNARSGDVALLAKHFLSGFNQTHGSSKRYADGALADLAMRPWPGNVRELRNSVLRGYLRADQVIQLADLTGDLLALTAERRSRTHVEIPVGASLAAAERSLTLATLEHCGGIRKQAAAMLGISLKTLYNRLEQYGRQSA